MKRWSSSLAIREMQIKTTPYSRGWLQSKRQTVTTVGKDVENFISQTDKDKYHMFLFI
jgi:hypothetical protein